jgi:ATP-binding cassette subfamily F protein 3
LLDEPTNDLDIQSRDALEQVLAEYGGALIVVSHDRYLLRRLAERVLWLDGGSATMIQGGYDAYEALRRGDAPAKAPAQASRSEAGLARTAAAAGRSEKARANRELAVAEAEVARLDRRKGEIEREFTEPATYDDAARVAELSRELRDLSPAIDAALARWEALAETS